MAATTTCPKLMTRSKGLLSTASARNPAGKVKTRKGNAATLDRSEMTKAEPER
jgi:hypothetical protein